VTRWLGIIVAGFWVMGLPDRAVAEEHALAAALVGSRVRLSVTSSGSKPVVGTLAAVDDKSLTLIVSGRRDPLVLTRSDVVSLERSVRPSHKRRGALIGSAIGFVAGFLIGGAITEWEGTSGGDFGPGKYVAAGAIMALPAAGIGAVVASGERWAEVPTDQILSAAARIRPGDRVQLSLRPSLVHSRGLAIAVSWR
jgi:hypothetical protein